MIRMTRCDSNSTPSYLGLVSGRRRTLLVARLTGSLRRFEYYEVGATLTLCELGRSDSYILYTDVLRDLWIVMEDM